MKTMLIFAAAMFAAQPLAAQSGPARAADSAAVRTVLSQYKSAVERLDAKGTERLFTGDSQVFENGGVEGSYANYLAKHLGPELGHFKSFKFSDYKVDVRFEGPVALTTETYNYRIETEKGEIVERRGVATSVLKKVGRDWKILSTHGSSRKPKVRS
ncbi:MAG: nuclear transport factor 2 family protein [Sphingomicrobium sp.]